MSEDNLQQFSRLKSTIEPSFWHKLSQIKLDVDKLDETERLIWGRYASNGTVALDVASFNSERTPGCVRGTLLNVNTLEAFKECDKDALLREHGGILEGLVSKGVAVEDPSLLIGRFVLLTFADLKKCHFYYWFAFLAPKSLRAYQCSPVSNLTEAQIKELEENITGDNPITVRLNNDMVEVLPLKHFGQGDLLGFIDPGGGELPSWPLRSLLWLVASTRPDIRNVDVLIIRRKVSYQVFHLKLDLNSDIKQWLGWEPNERGKLGPRRADLAATMDPVRLAESAVDLNLRLMKWRLMPELDLDVVSGSRCLLLGAGTLGCGVARGLLAWGVRNITLVDSGCVGFSNPVRQSLFNHEHCLGGGAPKATAAAESLRAIFPGVTAEGIHLSIPMPGHSIPEVQQTEVRGDCEKIENLIKEHDVIFLLMDTRESRWLPSLLAKLHGKLVINAALGFDSFLVMRHGLEGPEGADTSDARNIPGNQLGCYFCNDVVAPRNSTASRTLDQQCTVVRPGVAQMAAALAVELMVSVLQHPERSLAPATCDTSDPSCCPLGAVPHSVRGFLASFQLVTPASHAFIKCAACSSMVLQEYRAKGFEFLLQVFNSPGYLEDLTGLAELQKQSLAAEVWALSDSEDENTE